jgi:class 3 adenylate cyclase
MKAGRFMANMRTTVILKTDIVDSTPLTARLTQIEMGLQRKQHRRFISEIISKNECTIFQEEGDSFWIECPSVTTAVLVAIEIHQSLHAMQAGKAPKQRLAIRAVITVGDILFQENDTIGTTLSLTARIEKVTPADEIYLSQAAWLVLNKAEIQTSFVGEFQLKGFNEPEKVYKVDQKYRTRVLTDQYIVFTDAKDFTRLIKSMGVEQVESFLLEYDDLVNDVCEKYNGVIRQVSGDQYFLTFTECTQTLSALGELCQNWNSIVERYGSGISIGVHKGNMNVIRSYVYSDDIHTTVYLSGLSNLYEPPSSDIWIIGSGRIKEELAGTVWAGQFQELDASKANRDIHKAILDEHGAYRLLL